MNKIDKIKYIEKTIKILSSNPLEADTIKALKKQIDSMKPCTFGTYLDEPFNTHGCKTCGSPKLVLCGNEKKNKIANRFSSKYCNPANCKYFES